MTTYCLSVRQPWADLIVFGARRRTGDIGEIMRKDIENRTWRPSLTVTLPIRLVIHASARQTPDEYSYAANVCHQLSLQPPAYARPCRGGGVIGTAIVWRILAPGDDDLGDNLWRARSQYGWCLRDPQPLPFYACPGTLGIWRPTPEILALLALASDTPTQAAAQ